MTKGFEIPNAIYFKSYECICAVAIHTPYSILVPNFYVMVRIMTEIYHYRDVNTSACIVDGVLVLLDKCNTCVKCILQGHIVLLLCFWIWFIINLIISCLWLWIIEMKNVICMLQRLTYLGQDSRKFYRRSYLSRKFWPTDFA